MYNVLFISDINKQIEKDAECKRQELFVESLVFQYLRPFPALSVANDQVTTEKGGKKEVILIKKIGDKKEGGCAPHISKFLCFSVFYKKQNAS